MHSRSQQRVNSAPRNPAPARVAVIEPLEGRRLLSASPVHLASHFSGVIEFGDIKAATTVTITKQDGHKVLGLVQETNGPTFSFRGYLDNDRNLYFVFSTVGAPGHGFGHAVATASGKGLNGSEITYLPSGAVPSTFTVKSV